MNECYFFVEIKDPYSESLVRVSCVECSRVHPLHNPWYYSGKFGHWDVNCHFCNKVIHSVSEGTNLDAEPSQPQIKEFRKE